MACQNAEWPTEAPEGFSIQELVSFWFQPPPQPHISDWVIIDNPYRDLQYTILSTDEISRPPKNMRPFFLSSKTFKTSLSNLKWLSKTQILDGLTCVDWAHRSSCCDTPPLCLAWRWAGTCRGSWRSPHCQCMSGGRRKLVNVNPRILLTSLHRPDRHISFNNLVVHLGVN